MGRQVYHTCALLIIVVLVLVIQLVFKLCIFFMFFRFTIRMENRKLIRLCMIFGTAFLWWLVFFSSSGHRIFMLHNTAYVTQTTRSEDICTFTFIKNYIKKHKNSTNSGRFVGFNTNNSNISSSSFYSPGICNIKFENDASLTSCLQKTDTKKILFLGDSNIRKPTLSFLKILKKRHEFTCDEINNNIPLNYWPDWAITKSFTIIDCPWIFRRAYMCTKTLKLGLYFRFEVHYIRMNFLQSPVQFISNGSTMCPSVLNQNITTLEEYILGDYAAQMNPDIIILGSTAHMAYHNLSIWTEQEIWLMKNVMSLLPRETRVFWFAHMSYCNEKQDEKHSRIRIKDNGQRYTLAEVTHRQYIQFLKLSNEILLKDDHNIFPFFDLYSMSSSLCPEGRQDQFHCLEEFYDILMDTFWAVYCKSFSP